MKQLSFVIAVFVASAVVASAHGPAQFGDAEGGAGMMRYIEDQALQDDATHDKMEALMNKMMAGTLSETEAGEVMQFMQGQPGAFGMMMNRLGSEALMRKGAQSGFGGMMGAGGMMSSGWMGNMAGLYWSYWITIVLLWIFLGLGTYALWTWIGRHERK